MAKAIYLIDMRAIAYNSRKQKLAGGCGSSCQSYARESWLAKTIPIQVFIAIQKADQPDGCGSGH